MRSQRTSALRRFGIAVVATTGALLATASPASAVSDESPRNYFTNGAYLHSFVWIETWASGGCADFQTWAKVDGGSKPVAKRDWIRNFTKFDPWGVAPSVQAFGQSGDPVSTKWTNNNGSRGSYLSGNLCTNWRTIGVTGITTGTAFYNGQTKSVTAST